MDWDFAIERYRLPLLNVVVGLFAEIGLAENATVERLSKPLYRYALGVLRTAESAVRRLIIVAARNIVVEPREARPAKPRSKSSGKDKVKVKDKPKSKRGLLFKLFDPPKRFKKLFGRVTKRRKVEPRVHIMGADPDPRNTWLRFFGQPEATAPAPEVDEAIDDGTVNAIHLCHRLMAIKDALEDIPRHAMRLARWRARPVEERRPERSSPLRTGRPPGFRQRAKHEVDEILKECHWLARNVEPQLDDTS